MAPSMTRTETLTNKSTERPQGIYKTDEGWKHTKDANHVWGDKNGAATDYRFCLDWEARR